MHECPDDYQEFSVERKLLNIENLNKNKVFFTKLFNIENFP